MSTCLITVLLCTRNPRKDYLARTLDALKRQTLHRKDWELFVLDNDSDPPLADTWIPDWHPNAVLERILPAGKLHAIAHGVQRAHSDLLCTIDDDVLPEPDYLENAVTAFAGRPKLGVAGGRICGEFAIPPPPGFGNYLRYLAIRDFGASTRISSDSGLKPWTPCGAGMVFRKEAVLDFFGGQDGDRNIGRTEDTKMALHIASSGWATAYLPKLCMTHLIPEKRLTADYLESLIQLSAFKTTRYLILHDLYRPTPDWKRIAKNLLRGVYAPTPAGRLRRRMETARLLAEKEALSASDRHGLARSARVERLDAQVRQNQGYADTRPE